jgi:hypothetical protein
MTATLGTCRVHVDGIKEHTFSSGVLFLSTLGPRRSTRGVSDSLDNSSLDAVVLASSLGYVTSGSVSWSRRVSHSCELDWVQTWLVNGGYARWMLVGRKVGRGFTTIQQAIYHKNCIRMVAPSLRMTSLQATGHRMQICAQGHGLLGPSAP